MLKKFSRFLLIMLVVFLVSSSSLICFANEEHDHDNITTTETNDETTSNENTSVEENIYYGDLYIFDNNVVMDKLVDGNVFIIGNNVEITGNINGNLFVLANKLNLNSCTIVYSIYACANSVYYNGGCYYGDLYVASNSLDMSFNSFVARDVKALSSKIVCKSAVGRDVDFICDTLNFGEGSDTSAIYGNLRYTANKEISIPENVMVEKGTVTYTSNYNIENIVITFGTCIVTVLALYIILNKLTPKFIEKVNNNKFSVLSLIKALGIGLATFIIVLIFSILLAGTMVGISLAVILALLFAILYMVATPVLAIKITNALKSALRIEKTSMFYLVIILVSIILHGITLIPFIGRFLGLIINVTAIGLIVTLFLPHKKLTEEEKEAIEEHKKEVKENKEKRKQEKIEVKKIKKAQKLELKANKKKENLN